MNLPKDRSYIAQTPFRSLLRDRDGSALLYVTIALAVLFGMAALAIDVGRLATTSTHAKQAADAAAIAAASQLDGQLDSITRAKELAKNTTLVQNKQTLGATPGGITIVNIRFLDGLPAGDPSVPNDPSELDPFVVDDTVQENALVARFAEVTTEQVVQNNMFIRALGGGATASAAGVSVAGFTQTICRRAPFVVCNPAEESVTGAPFNTAYWKGKQIHIKASGPTAAWTPGDFGLADVEGVQSAKEVADMLAESEPDVCISALIDVKPGQTQSTRTGLNTRFDMYENPFFGSGAARTNVKIRPAKNVIKGYMPSDLLDPCSKQDPVPGTTMGLPRDVNLDGINRFGNGIWDCLAYWNVNHPSDALPPGCTSTSDPSTMSRYQLYRLEIDTPGLIPNNGPTNENGYPQCHATAPNPDEAPDRREVIFAVINCIEHGPISGNSAGPIPVEAFVKAFLTEPVASGPNFDTFLEVIDITKPGADDGILHDMVHLYR